jgi:hypothetical protein
MLEYKYVHNGKFNPNIFAMDFKAVQKGIVFVHSQSWNAFTNVEYYLCIFYWRFHSFCTEIYKRLENLSTKNIVTNSYALHQWRIVFPCFLLQSNASVLLLYNLPRLCISFLAFPFTYPCPPTLHLPFPAFFFSMSIYRKCDMYIVFFILYIFSRFYTYFIIQYSSRLSSRAGPDLVGPAPGLHACCWSSPS